jgi:hypothetical protein
MPDLLKAWLTKSPHAKASEIVVEDGNQLDYRRMVSLLKEGYDCILVNLRLPGMLAIRLAEVVNLAKVPTRITLVSGAPHDLGIGLSLFDSYIRIPFHGKNLDVVLDETIGAPFFPEHRPLPSQEHLDLAILNLLQNYSALAPTCRSALHAFGLYRDAYLHRPVSASRHQQISSGASVLQRIEFFSEVRPLNFSQRISLVTNAVNQSGFYLPWQKLFLSFQFNHLLDAIGLTLMNFRSETEDVLKLGAVTGSVASSITRSAGAFSRQHSVWRAVSEISTW